MGVESGVLGLASTAARLVASLAAAATAYLLMAALTGGGGEGDRLERLAARHRRSSSDGPEPGPAVGYGPLLRGREVVRKWLHRAFPPDAEVEAALAARSRTGRPAWDPLGVRVWALSAGTLAGLFLALPSLATGRPLPLAALGLTAVAALAGPGLWFRYVLAQHRREVARELTRVAEILTLGTESGLGLIEAVRLAAGLFGGPVGRALRLAVAEMDAGRETVAALRAAAGRVGGHAMGLFVASVVQGLELGTPVARVLRAQAEVLRSRRTQELEAAVGALPLRLTVVTVVLFLPALLVLTVLPNLLAFLQGSW
ncbi:MAG: type II secretion system F family protein [Firmicutes bacterium]|nr:type II secretion system F family protein [Bacillota bacterium]